MGYHHAKNSIRSRASTIWDDAYPITRNARDTSLITFGANFLIYVSYRFRLLKALNSLSIFFFF